MDCLATPPLSPPPFAPPGRREKNRQAARKCRSKKIRCTNETEVRLVELRRCNQGLREEVARWQARFAREAEHREALKVGWRARRGLAWWWSSGG